MIKETTKKEIRKEVFKRRREADPAVLAKESEMICRKIIESPQFQKADSVYVYMDCKGEVSIKLLLETAWKQGKRTAAPRVTGPGEMKYYYFHSYEDLKPGYYDIPDPVTGEEAHDEQALLIVPGVAFDRNRHRCGYGQGFYDRYLSKHTSHFTEALAFEFQMMEEVPTEPTDLLPDVVITEKTIYR